RCGHAPSRVAQEARILNTVFKIRAGGPDFRLNLARKLVGERHNVPRTAGARRHSNDPNCTPPHLELGTLSRAQQSEHGLRGTPPARRPKAEHRRASTRAQPKGSKTKQADGRRAREAG